LNPSEANTSLQNELILAREMLAAEQARSRNIHAFGELAREATNTQAFGDLAAEHITSIFGLRASAFFVFAEDSGELVRSSVIGMDLKPADAFPAEDLAITWRDTKSEQEERRKTAIIYDGREGGAVRRMKLQQVIACPCYDAERNLVALLVGARTQVDRDETEPLTDDLLPSFTMFSEQAGGILTQLRNLQTNSTQLEAIKRSEQLLTLAIEGAQIGTWDRDELTGIAYFNEYWASIMGFTKAELGPPWPCWEDCTHPEDFEAAESAFDAHLRGETDIYEATYRTRHKDGHWVWILDRGRVMERDSDGRALRVCGTHIDISASKNAEAEHLAMQMQIQQSQKLESLGVLAGGVAHDFNNILTVIQANADLALWELHPKSTVRPHLEEIERGSKRAAGLAAQMLAFAGRDKLIVEPLNLTDLVGEMIQLLTVSISKDILLKHDRIGGQPVFEGDSSQIRQVVMNLIINAAEAIGSQAGEIIISTGTVHCDEHSLQDFPRSLLNPNSSPLVPGTYVMFEVKDSGCGMDDETRRRVFEPFFTTKFAGRGLGMAALLGILHRHGGALRFKSEVDNGTTFTIILPAKQALVIGDEWLPVSPQELQAESHGLILLVDDEQGIRKIGTQFLEHLGYEVVTACDGVEAVEVVSEQGAKLACVVLDLTMPRMGGDEAHRQIKQLAPDLPVILSSGYMERDATERFSEFGLAAFLKKPYSLQHLKLMLENTIRRL
jgi:two-component system cell cycle sensor histidine kinase/response regulator CckA